MTAKEIISNKEQSGFECGYASDVYYHTKKDIEEMLQEYAKIKCAELLEIVAEKAETREMFINGSSGGWYDKVGKVNKDSILNSVNLETFIF